MRGIPDGNPQSGVSLTVTRASDGAGVGSAIADSEGFCAVQINGSPGPVKCRFQRGAEIWQDDSRAMMAVGSTALAELQDLIAMTHRDGVLPHGAQFAAGTVNGNTQLQVQGGAVVLDGVLAVWYTATTVANGGNGDRAIVAQQTHADGRTELTEIAYTAIGSTVCVPLWRFTRATTISNLTWIGQRTLLGLTNYHPCQANIARLPTGSTTNASGEASGLETTVTLEAGVDYQVTAKASAITRARDGAIAVEIDGNLSPYVSAPGDVTVTLKNSHKRDITGSGAAVTVRMFERSDTLLTDWATLGTFGPVFNGLAMNEPRQVATDSSGNVYIADPGNSRLVKISSGGVYQASITGLSDIYGVAVDGSGNISVALHTGVRAYTSALTLLWADNPNNVVFGFRHVATDGTHVYVAHGVANEVEKRLATTGALVASWGTTGSGNGQFNTPRGIAYSSISSELYVVDSGNSRVQVFNTSGTYIRQFAVPANSRGIGVDASGDVWLAVHGSDELRQYSSTGTLLNTLSQTDPEGVALASGDVLWCSNSTDDTVVKRDETASAFNWDTGLLTVLAIPRT